MNKICIYYIFLSSVPLLKHNKLLRWNKDDQQQMDSRAVSYRNWTGLTNLTVHMGLWAITAYWEKQESALHES